MDDLKTILKHFQVVNLIPVIGIEWEFYLLDQKNPLSGEKHKLFFQNFLKLSKNYGINSLKIEKEQGKGQIEIKTNPYLDIPKLCRDFLLIKKIVRKISFEMNLEADFTAQKYNDDCGSSLQINLNFLDKNNKNLFNGSSQDESQLLLYSIAGILNLTEKYLENYISSKEDLIRFDKDINIKLHKSGNYTAPTNLSWGYDNRTTAIRVIGKNDNRRLEFRIPSSNSYIFKVVESLLESVLSGVAKKELPQKAIYGNAFKDRGFLFVKEL